MESITPIVTALAAGATAANSEVAGKAVKDAYAIQHLRKRRGRF